MSSTMSKSQKKTLKRILTALAIFVVIELLPLSSWLASPYDLWVSFALFLIPYLIAGYDVLAKAWHGITHGQVFDEHFLMAIATIGAFALVFFPEAEPHMAEGAAVMIFYQVGEWFQDYAVDKSRNSISAMMDIAPEYANLLRDGRLEEVDPYDVTVGDTIVVKPGERVPLDGVVIEGSSQVDTAAITGESVPRVAGEGSEVISGCVNLTGALTVQVTKEYDDSTVQRVLELVENASERKARTENFITRFARYYTPVVVISALVLAFIPPLFTGQPFAGWIQRALVFLVVSCPCALVISVPLSFFSGIGAASKAGILVKGSNYLEVLASADTVAFDKTGTLTNGTFSVVAVHAHEGIDPDDVLELAAKAEVFSDHPVAKSVREAFGGDVSSAHIEAGEERSGRGVVTMVEGKRVLVGNGKLMADEGISAPECELVGTVLHVACDGRYLGHIVIADTPKNDAQETIRGLHEAGIRRTVMLTGDREEVAAAMAKDLGIDEYHAQLLPQDKVALVEKLIGEEPQNAKLAFVGDGINDAPVLMRADVGIAMGAMGSDAAIEAADIVLMDDKPSNIATAIHVARKTMRIVWQNIIFAIGVKVLILVLAVFGLANMWLAVFGVVGVACLCVANAMRCLRVVKR